MEDDLLRVRLEKLLVETEDCDLIDQFATDPQKRERFIKLATDLRGTGCDVEAKIAGRAPASVGGLFHCSSPPQFLRHCLSALVCQFRRRVIGRLFCFGLIRLDRELWFGRRQPCTSIPHCHTRGRMLRLLGRFDLGIKEAIAHQKAAHNHEHHRNDAHYRRRDNSVGVLIILKRQNQFLQLQPYPASAAETGSNRAMVNSPDGST